MERALYVTAAAVMACRIANAFVIVFVCVAKDTRVITGRAEVTFTTAHAPWRVKGPVANAPVVAVSEARAVWGVAV